ncbi:MAG: hypothetical protein QOE45_775 [Frankiaceae bacterium]|jgi:hypothetical protein|nr:hypothetical protein [Frankiaceae bacterium]
MGRAGTRALAAAGALALVAAGAAHAVPRAVLALPKPVGEIPPPQGTFPDRPERLKRSIVPGRVDDTERVSVLVGPDGTPGAVGVTQRLVLSGTGQFIVWERATAQDAEALDDTLDPVLKREAVIWQGFVSGSKTLAARLTLDPAVETELLPLRVEIAWRGAGRIAPGGALPGPGEVVVRVVNRTGNGVSLPTGDVAPEHLAGPLDALLEHATSRTTVAPPMAGRGLPLTLPATRVGPPRDRLTVAPFRVTGTLRVDGAGATGEGPGSTPVTGGLKVDGVLEGTAEFVLRAPAAGRLLLDLTAVPTLDPRTLQPPRGRTWAEWLHRSPTQNETRAALTQLVEAAAAAARDDQYAPYLGHHGSGRVDTTFHFGVAPADVVTVAARPLRPKAFPMALAGVALLALLANGTAIWRRL